jgi:hypothetical protein
LPEKESINPDLGNAPQWASEAIFATTQPRISRSMPRGYRGNTVFEAQKGSI